MKIPRGKILKNKRLQLGWTQSTLLHFCRRMGMICGLSKISFWENGHKEISDRDWQMLIYIFGDSKNFED